METQRHTETHRDPQRLRETFVHVYVYILYIESRHTYRHTDTQRHRHTQRQRDTETYKDAQGHTHKHLQNLSQTFPTTI